MKSKLNRKENKENSQLKNSEKFFFFSKATWLSWVFWFAEC